MFILGVSSLCRGFQQTAAETQLDVRSCSGQIRSGSVWDHRLSEEILSLQTRSAQQTQEVGKTHFLHTRVCVKMLAELKLGVMVAES